MKSEKEFGPNFFWVLGGIPKPNTNPRFEYFIIPSSVMAKNVVKAHQLWLRSPGVKGQKHKDNTVRIVYLPPYKSGYSDFDLSKYRDRWDLIEKILRS